MYIIRYTFKGDVILHFVDIVYSLLNKNSKNMIIWGIIFLFIGIIILYLPEILVIFVSALFLFMGFLFLYVAWRIRKHQDQYNQYTIFINE